MKYRYKLIFFTLLIALSLGLKSTYNLGPDGRLLGEVYEGKAAQMLLKKTTNSSYKYISHDLKPFKYRFHEKKTTHYGHFYVESDIYHYCNNFDELRKREKSKTIKNHAYFAVPLWLLVSFDVLGSVVQRAHKTKVSDHSLADVLPVFAILVSFATLSTYLGYTCIQHYNNIGEEEYLAARREHSYQHDSLAKSLPVPHYYKKLFTGLAASVCAGLIVDKTITIFKK